MKIKGWMEPHLKRLEESGLIENLRKLVQEKGKLRNPYPAVWRGFGYTLFYEGLEFIFGQTREFEYFLVENNGKIVFEANQIQNNSESSNGNVITSRPSYSAVTKYFQIKNYSSGDWENVLTKLCSK